MESIKKIVGILESLKIDYMLLGGWALPAYGNVRATVDVDIALCPEIAINRSRLEKLRSELKKKQVEIVTSDSSESPVFAWADLENKVEGEFWFKPDGVPMKNEVLERRIRRRIGDVEVWVIGPEDFIVNALARSDRGPSHDQDALSVLMKSSIDQSISLDMEYLERRAKSADVSGLLRSLQRKLQTQP